MREGERERERERVMIKTEREKKDRKRKRERVRKREKQQSPWHQRSFRPQRHTRCRTQAYAPDPSPSPLHQPCLRTPDALGATLYCHAPASAPGEQVMELGSQFLNNSHVFTTSISNVVLEEFFSCNTYITILHFYNEAKNISISCDLGIEMLHISHCYLLTLLNSIVISLGVQPSSRR